MLTAARKFNEFFSKGLWVLDTGSSGAYKRFFVRVAKFTYIAVREFSEGQLNFRAMSFVYTTLLSLVPLLAVSFSVLKAFGVHNQMEPFLMSFLAPLGPSGADITRRIVGFVGNMKVGVLGTIGLAMLMYTVISLIAKMEDALNYIWRINRPRSFSRRFSDYMSVLLVGPILIFSAIGFTAAVKSGSVVQAILSIGPLGAVFYFLGVLIPYVSTCAAFTFVYSFMPSTKVRLKSALAGGVFAGVCWELTGWGFATFVASSAQYSAIYSGFAIIILFMMWMYISWLIFLVGATVSFYHQHPQYLVMRKKALVASNRLKERLALSVLYLIGESYAKGSPPWTLDTLVERLSLPVEPVQEALDILVSGGFLFDTGGELPCYLPARDIETIMLDEALVCLRAAGEETFPVNEKSLSMPPLDKVTKAVEEAMGAVVKGITLKELVHK